jgi:hypothetical protein
VPYSPNLDRLLTDGTRYRDERAEYVIERHTAGEVHFPTGQVVACDPLTDAHAAAPFTVTVAAGTYPLYAWVAVLYRDSAEQQRRVAALQLVVSDAAQVRYELAVTAGQDLPLTSIDESGMSSDLLLRSRQFSASSGRSHAGVPPMCPDTSYS